MIENPRARNAQKWLAHTLNELAIFGYSSDFNDVALFSPKYYLLNRIKDFPFEKYPDYTAPWHLLTWEHIRWEYVYFILRIIESLKHVKGSFANNPVELQPFQILILICFLGPYDPKTNLRLVRTILLTIARKNGKSNFIADLLTAMMSLKPEKGGLYRQEILVGAADRNQAGEIYDMVSGAIAQDKKLGLVDKYKCTPSAKRVIHAETLTKLQIISSEAYRAHGRNAVAIVYDEIGNVPHSIAEEYYNVLTSGFGAQEEGVTMLLSTQAASDTHVFSAMVDRCKQHNQGKWELYEDEDDEANIFDIAGFIFETPDIIERIKIDPHDQNIWYLANPVLLVEGRWKEILLRDLKKQSKEAKTLPSLESKFRNRRLNQRTNPYNPVISKSIWEANIGKFDFEDLEGKKCWAGIDLSTVLDLTALVLVFEEINGCRPVVPYFWMPREGLEARQRKDKVPYLLWVKEGHINADSDKAVEYRMVAQTLGEIADKYDLQGIGFDKHKIEDLKTAMRDQDLRWMYEDSEDFFISIWQGAKYFEPAIQALETALVKEELAHNANPVLTWCAANAVSVTSTDGYRKLDKAKSYGRIDGIVALAQALRAEEIQNYNEDQGEESAAEDFIM